MPIKTVFIFGNVELEMDSLPTRLIPQLQKAFPDISFELKDPNEEWDVPEEMIIIDTVIGPEEVTVFNDLDEFTSSPQLTMHDFDALANLKYLKKLGRLKEVIIIGVPTGMSEERAMEGVREVISN